MKKPDFQYETWIRTTSQQLWEAITSPEFTRQYFHGMAIDSDWVPGSPVRFRYPDGRVGVEGEIIESQPYCRLAYTWRFLHDSALAAEQPSRVDWEIEAKEGVCRLRVSHTGFAAGSRVLPMITEGWSPILCSLKSLLETGAALADVPSAPAA